METAGSARPPIPATVDDVVGRLDDVIRTARRDRNRVGYFAALYRGVTVRVGEGIGAGRYQDGSRMEQLVVVFANRYLEAEERFRRGEHPGQAWQAAFSAASRWRPIVLQHLLLGINAHINVDLGVACAIAGAEGGIGALRRDFDAINDLLHEMTEEVQDRLARVWPPLRWLDQLGARSDDEVFHFSLRVARAAAWATAERLAVLDAEAQADEVARLDRRVAVLSRLILHPGLKGSLISLLVRLGEADDVAAVMDILS